MMALPGEKFYAILSPNYTRTYLNIPRVCDGGDLGAVLDGGRRRVLNVHKAADGDEMRPNRPVPLGLRQNRG